MRKASNKKDNEVTYTIDTYDKGFVSQIPWRLLSSDALAAAINVYYNDAYQLVTFGGWNITAAPFTDKFILFSFDELPVFVSRLTNVSCKLFYTATLSTNIGINDSGSADNWGGFVWLSGEATYTVYVYYQDGTSNFKCWRVTEAGITEVTATITGGGAAGMGIDNPDGMFVFADRSWAWKGLTLYWSDATLPEDFGAGTSGNAPIRGQKGTKITSTVEFFDNLVVFLDESTIRFIGRNPNTWSLSVISPTIGCPHRAGVSRVGTDVFFTSQRGVAYLTAVQMYGAISMDELSMNVTDFLVDNIFSRDAVSMVYSQEHKSLVLSAISDSAANIFMTLKILRKKQGGQWTTGVISTADNFAANIDTNYYSPIFLYGGVLYVSSAVVSGSTYSNIATGVKDEDTTSDSRVVWVLNLEDEVSFRNIQMKLSRIEDSLAYWRSGLWRESQWRGEGLTFDIDWYALGSKKQGGGEGSITLTENEETRFTIGVTSHNMQFSVLLNNVKGEWIFGILQILTRYVRSVVSKEV